MGQLRAALRPAARARRAARAPPGDALTPRTRTARLELLAGAALFSTGGAAIKYCRLGSWQVAGFRSIVAAIALALLLPSARGRWTWRTAVVGIAYAFTLVLFVAANKLTTSAATIFLQSTAPLYLLLLGPWLLKERVHARDLTIIAALAAGLVMMVAGGDAPQATAPNPLLGNVFAALSGLSYAFTLAGLRWLGRGGNNTSSLTAVTLGNVIAFAGCLPFIFPMPAVSTGDVLSLAFLGVFQIAVAYVFVTGGIGHVPALEASLLLLLEPVLNPVWSWLVHGERPGAWTIGGGLLILTATGWQATRER